MIRMVTELVYNQDGESETRRIITRREGRSRGRSVGGGGGGGGGEEEKRELDDGCAILIHVPIT